MLLNSLPRLGRALALGAATLALAGTTALAAPLTIAHSQGELTLQSLPQKVLVLDVNALDIADALGAKPAGGLASNLPAYLSPGLVGADWLAAGTIFEPDFEAIAAANADLMIIGTRSARAWPEMSALLPTIDLSLKGPHFAAVKGNITQVGAVFGLADKAAELNATLEQKLAQLKAVAPGAGTALILVTNGGKLGAYGPTSRVGWIHTELGFAPVEENIDDRFHGGDVISFEYILERNPDWIFVIDRDAGVESAGEGAKAVLDNALMAQTSAVQNGRLVHLDPYAAYIAFGGYTANATLLDQISAALSAAR